jgi:hypothetical protein
MNSRFIILLTACGLVACSPSNKPESQWDVWVSAYDSTKSTNDFYDDEPVVRLGGASLIEIGGEVTEPVTVNIADLPVRSVIVKETRLEGNEILFTGAYRYDGISLADILNQVKVSKKNAGEFNPIIDQYVVVYGAAGDSAVFSWGELFYATQLHRIIIATRVTRIVPTKSGDKWPLPEKARLIAGNDLITGRNISDPVKIMVRSIGVQYKVDRSVAWWSPEMVIKGIGDNPYVIEYLPDSLVNQRFDHVFYGRGMGIHGITETRGVSLKDLFSGSLKPDRGLVSNGLFVIAAVDGYRCSVSYSELMNRNDRADVILVDHGDDRDGGRFSCLFTADFFSDRAIKAITEIRLVQ